MEICVVQPGDLQAIAHIRALFLEYAAELEIDLCFQGFRDELDTLPGKYGPPNGILLLVLEESEPVGCGALRPLEEGVCELKRIYVRSGDRAKGLGRLITKELIERARLLGYRAARLDTLPTLTKAISLYQTLGFVEIPPYNQSPKDLGVVYFELNLV